MRVGLKESWAPKNWCFWTVVLEKTLESSLDCKETQPVHPKGNESWIFIGRTDAEAEAPILWLPDRKNQLFGEDPRAEEDWRQEEKQITEDEMVAWHHQLSGHEFEQDLGVGDGQGSFACWSPWGHKELDTTEWLNWSTGSKNSLYCWDPCHTVGLLFLFSTLLFSSINTYKCLQAHTFAKQQDSMGKVRVWPQWRPTSWPCHYLCQFTLTKWFNLYISNVNKNNPK